MKETLYYLIFKPNVPYNDVYYVYEQHCGQEKGCFLTDEEYIGSIQQSEVDKFVKEFEHDLIEGKVDGITILDADD